MLLIMKIILCYVFKEEKIWTLLPEPITSCIVTVYLKQGYIPKLYNLDITIRIEIYDKMNKALTLVLLRCLTIF